ncbi:hypothetical protein GCM10010468_12300 [Actinocorallia longicatena]|uniref:Conjugative transposon protein TcpC n=1 Tax=Actinocorallia longicatena TaxID=111803 RepID=A0ABP6Q2Q9_9ACTN
MDDGPTALEESWDVPKPQSRKKGWGGGGGRWWIWVGRILLWTFVLVVIVNGIRAPFERFTAKDGATTTVSSTPTGDQFPVSAASTFALQFTQIYLHYDQGSAQTRAEQLSRFLPADADDQFGWNGLGQLSAGSIEVSTVDVKDPNNALVNIVAQLGTRWVQLAVPVYTKDGSYVISGPPALLEVPPTAQVPNRPGIEHDTALETYLKDNLLTGFFTAYAKSDGVILKRYTGDNPSIQGLGSAVNFGSLGDVNAPKGASEERVVTATVQWIVPPTQPRGSESMVTQAYELTVVKKGDTWNVTSIRGVQAGS